jgi:hypothetical protein
MSIVRQPPTLDEQGELVAGRWPTAEECLAKWPREQRAAIRKMRAADLTELPTNRVFRAAWRDNGKIEVDMPAAREIWRNTLRQLREPLLAALDVAYQKADEKGDAEHKVEIAAKKQVLRDVTADAAIEQAQTPEELMAVIPAALRGE